MTAAESLCAAQRLASEIFTRNLSAWCAVHAFRWMARLGLPHATNHAAEQLEQGFQTVSSMAKDAKQSNVLENMIKAATKQFTGDWPKLADPGFLTKALIEQSATTFESALDAATLIFTHSVLDSAAFDWCRVCALAKPEDFMPHIDKKKVTLSEVQEAASFSALRETAIDGYLDSLEKAPLIEKLDLIFSLCQPSHSFMNIDENYHYDRERIIALDNLRHDYVHHGGLGSRLPHADDDLSFLLGTDMFLAMLVCERFQLLPRPNPIIDFLLGVLAPPQTQ